MKIILTQTLLIILFSHTSCVVEDVVFGDYYITNNTNNILVLEAFDKNKVPMKIELLQTQINPGVKAHIFTAIERTGGHVMPSNFWSELYVYNQVVADSTIVYSGINDADWQVEGRNAEGHNILNLVVY